MGEYIQNAEQCCRKRKAYAIQWIRHAHLKLPNIRDLSRRMNWAASTDPSAISAANRQWTEATFSPEARRVAWSEALLKLSTRRR